MKRESLNVAWLSILLLFTIGSPALKADFTPIAGWDNQLFPSYLIATAALKPDPSAQASHVLGDADGQLGVIVKATADKQAVVVTIRCDQFMETSEYRGILPKAGESYTINPKARFRFDELSKCRQATPATVVFRVKLGADSGKRSPRPLPFDR